MEFKVVKVNEAIKNAVVSHKALIESDLAEQRETIISGLEKGQVLEGVVKNITDFGAFMDLGGVDGSYQNMVAEGGNSYQSRTPRFSCKGRYGPKYRPDP